MPAMFHQQTLRQPGSQYLLIGQRKTPKMTGICTNKEKLLGFRLLIEIWGNFRTNWVAFLTFQQVCEGVLIR